MTPYVLIIDRSLTVRMDLTEAFEEVGVSALAFASVEAAGRGEGVGRRRAGLSEEASDPAAAWGAAHPDGRYAKLLRAPNAMSRVCSGEKPVSELEIEDAMSYACGEGSPWYAATAGGWDPPIAAAGMSLKDFLGDIFSAHPVLSRCARRPFLQLDGGPRMSCQCGRGI